MHAVATGEDVHGLLIGRKIYDMPILADGVVRFIGEKVAAVAAESEEIAEEALELIDVEYEELEPLLDPLEAIEPTAALLHPNVQSYRGLLHPIEQPSNVFVHMNWKKGDVEAGFREADIVVENIFTTKPVHQAYIEPHACVVRAQGDGGADIWALFQGSLRAARASRNGVQQSDWKILSFILATSAAASAARAISWTCRFAICCR